MALERVQEMRLRKSAGYTPLGKAELEGRQHNTLRLRCKEAVVEVTALAPDLFRVGMFPDGRPPDYRSEAVAKEDWEPVEARLNTRAGELALSTKSSSALVSLDPLRIRFADATGREFAADDPELGMGAEAEQRNPHSDGRPVRLYKTRADGERYFGGGERTSGLEKTGTYQVFYNIDPPEGHTASFNNLYTSIPFVLSLEGGMAHGLFLDNTHRAEFDLAREQDGRACFAAEGGALIYYVFCGPTPADVLERYTELTGRTPMPPMWSLGYQQSRYSYESEAEITEIARNFRERDIPCDVLYLDIDYMDGYRVFTWDREDFPDPKNMISRLNDEGFRVVTIIDPGVKVDENYPVYTEGRSRDLFCRTLENGEYHNVVWPGVCAFPDFTSARAREWWGENHRGLVEDGVSGIWCDMNEPSLFIPMQSSMPGAVVHPGDEEPRMHAQIHNTYGSLMARATREGLLRLRPENRPFVITRAGYAGLQRHALQWTGDNSSWWEHLWMSMPQLQNMGLSGVAWAGVDVGGFFGDCDGELLARFTEFGVFQPFCRNHTMKDSRHQEPWAFGEPYESVCRKMIGLRQRLLPYLYSLFEESHRTGAPILRPLLFEHPDDPATYAADDEFLLGDALLVAPITRPGIEHRHVYLPRGTWFHYWSGERFEGPDHILAHAPLGEPPLYVRANRAIPLWPQMNHTAERSPDPLTLLIHADEGSGLSTLYEDSGDGYAHLDGEYSRRTVHCESASGHISVRISGQEGSFRPSRERIVMELRGAPQPREVRTNGEEADWSHDNGTLYVRLSEGAGEQHVEVEA